MKNLLETSEPNDLMNMKELKVRVLDHISKFINNQTPQQLAKYRSRYLVPDENDVKTKSLSNPLGTTKQ